MAMVMATMDNYQIFVLCRELSTHELEPLDTNSKSINKRTFQKKKKKKTLKKKKKKKKKKK